MAQSGHSINISCLITPCAQSWRKCLLGHWAGGITRPGQTQAPLLVRPGHDPGLWASAFPVHGGDVPSVLSPQDCGGSRGGRRLPTCSHYSLGSKHFWARPLRHSLTGPHGKAQLQGPMTQGVGQGLGQLYISVLKEPSGDP